MTKLCTTIAYVIGVLTQEVMPNTTSQSSYTTMSFTQTVNTIVYV